MTPEEYNAIYQQAFDKALAELRNLIAEAAKITNEIATVDQRMATLKQTIWCLADLAGVELPEELRRPPEPPPKPRRRHFFKEKRPATSP